MATVPPRFPAFQILQHPPEANSVTLQMEVARSFRSAGINQISLRGGKPKDDEVNTICAHTVRGIAEAGCKLSVIIRDYASYCYVVMICERFGYPGGSLSVLSRWMLVDCV